MTEENKLRIKEEILIPLMDQLKVSNDLNYSSGYKNAVYNLAISKIESEVLKGKIETANEIGEILFNG